MTEQLQKELEDCGPCLAARLIGVSVQTIHNWRKAGKIEARQNAAGRWRFNVTPFVKREA